MNREKRTKVNYRQLIIFSVLAIAAVYHFSRPTLEKWTGMSLPAITENGKRGGNSSGGHSYDAKLPSDDGVDRSNYGKQARDWLTDIGGNKFKSPAGLVYGGGREHRIDHVLLHCVDNPSKPTHGIFVGDAVEVMKLVDEAYEMAKSGSNKVDSQKSGDKMTHTASMGRVIGHTGGKKAQRSGAKELKKIKLVLAGNNVITAFPK